MKIGKIMKLNFLIDFQTKNSNISNKNVNVIVLKFKN